MKELNDTSSGVKIRIVIIRIIVIIIRVGIIIIVLIIVIIIVIVMIIIVIIIVIIIAIINRIPPEDVSFKSFTRVSVCVYCWILYKSKLLKL